MDSWSFDSIIIRDENIMMEWDVKPPVSVENSVLVPIQNSAHNSSFPEVGIEDMTRNQIPHNSTRNISDDNASVGDIISPNLATANVTSGNEASSSRFSSSVLDSNSQESSLIDLQLGGFGDNSHSNSTSTANILSSADSSAPSKRARVKSLSFQTTYCQVYGCQKDLSSEKDYLRRHKVCDVHSKTPKVIVNGVEQRFCQQCSRFHLLGEFDDAKRSCRKRLAGHNERRRKPQLGFSSGNERLFHSYTGSNFQEFSPTSISTSTSFTCQNSLMVDVEFGSARSLLSSQLRKFSDHSSQIPEPEVHPLIVNEVSEDFFGIPNRNSLCNTNSTGRNQQTSVSMHHNADTPINQSKS